MLDETLQLILEQEQPSCRPWKGPGCRQELRCREPSTTVRIQMDRRRWRPLRWRCRCPVPAPSGAPGSHKAQQDSSAPYPQARTVPFPGSRRAVPSPCSTFSLQTPPGSPWRAPRGTARAAAPSACCCCWRNLQGGLEESYYAGARRDVLMQKVLIAGSERLHHPLVPAFQDLFCQFIPHALQISKA